MSIEIQALGQAAFSLTVAKGEAQAKHILIDPILSTGETPEAFVAAHPANYVLITHLYDAWQDCVRILKALPNTTLVAQERVAQFLKTQMNGNGLNTITMSPGHELDFPWVGMPGTDGIGSLVMTETGQQKELPGNPTPYEANGFIINAEGHQVYHAGPQPFQAELRNIGLTYKPDVVILPVSKVLGYGEEEVSRAVMWLGCDIVIPVDVTEADKVSDDFNFDEIYASIDIYTAAICRALQPSQSYTLEPTHSSGRAAGPEDRY